LPSTLVLAEPVPSQYSAVQYHADHRKHQQFRTGPTASREPEAPSLLTCFVCHQVPCSNAQRPEDLIRHEAHPLHDGGREGCVALFKVTQQLFGPCTALGTVLGQELVNYQLTCDLVRVWEVCDWKLCHRPTAELKGCDDFRHQCSHMGTLVICAQRKF
jgi:hypothetical protein